MSNKFQDYSNADKNKQQSFKCTKKPSCYCSMCKRQNQIIDMFQQRQHLQWFGRKKMNKIKYSTKEHSTQLIRTDKKRKSDNQKNLSENFDIYKKYLQCKSSYLNNYSKKTLQKTQTCFPQSNIAFQKSPIDPKQSIYNDSYHLQNLRLDKQKPIKRLQQKFDLPFIGKSTYNQQFSERQDRQKTEIIKPRNGIKTLDLQTNHQRKSTSLNTTLTRLKNGEMFRPPSPFKPQGHMMKSNSFTNAYNTLYKNSFTKQISQTIDQAELNPQFVRKSKFGSFSKVRWPLSKNNHGFKREKSLELYD